MSVNRYNLLAVEYYDGATCEEIESECGDWVLASDYDELRERHNALVDAVHKAMGRTADCDKKQTNDQLIADVAYLNRLALGDFRTSIICGNRAFAAEQKYDELRERVKKMIDAYRNAENCSCPYCKKDFDAARKAVEELL